MSPAVLPFAAWRNLAFATVSFAISFAAWGLISGFAPSFRTDFGLDPQQTAVLIAVPVLFVVVLLVVQMWLLTATLESYLAGHVEVALPAFLSSAALFAGVTALYRMVVRLDRSADAEPRGSVEGPWLIE